MKKCLLIIMMGLMAASASAELNAGDVILMYSLAQGGDGTSTEITGDGMTWNRLATEDAVSGADIYTADGVDDGVKFTVVDVGAQGSKTGGVGLRNLSWIPSDLTMAFLWENVDGLEYTISGLDPTLKYNVNIALNGNTTDYNGLDVTVDGAAGLNSTDYAAYTQGQSSTPLDMQWVNLSSDGTLTIKVVVNSASRTSTPIVRIEAVSGGPAPVVGTLFVIK